MRWATAMALTGALIFTVGDAAAEGSKPISTAMTCGEMMAFVKEHDNETLGVAVLWLDGVYSNQSGKTSIPGGWARTLGEGVGGACAMAANSARKVIEVIGEVHEKNAPSK
jgi:hypothetical protein